MKQPEEGALQHQDRPPNSVHVPWFAAVQLVCLALTVKSLDPSLENYKFGAFAFLGSSIPMALLEIVVNRVHTRPSTGLSWGANFRPSVSRTGVKLFGFICTLLCCIFCCWLCPQLRSKHYQATFQFFVWAAPALIPFAVGYVYYVDGRMVHPKDGLYLFGALALRRVEWAQLSESEKAEVALHCTSWIIKLYYAPMMFGMFCNSMKSTATNSYKAMLTNPHTFASRITTAVTAVDLLAAVSGYWCGFRLLDSHIRSTNPYFYGWAVTISMYDPFWALISQKFLPYGNRDDWHTLLPQVFPGQTWLVWAWAGALVTCKLTWAWANILYGFRFSNLTNRGIVTAGPYRWTKHASYVSKNLSWWISAVPFLGSDLNTCLRESLGLLGTNLFYYARAMAEERHLSQDEEYVRYAVWVEQHSPLRFLSAWFPSVFRYTPPAAFKPADAEELQLHGLHCS